MLRFFSDLFGITMTFFQTDTILDNLWLNINNSSPAFIEAIPPIESSHVNTPPQENVAFKTNGVVNQNEMSNTIETPEIKTGRSRNRKIGLKRAKKPIKNTNLSMDQEVLNFLHEKDTIDSEEDSSLHSDEDNNPNEPMTVTMNLVGAKKSTDQNILNESRTKSNQEFQLTEFGSNSSKSSLVPQIAFNQECLVVKKSLTSPTDLHNKANDAVPSGSKVLCNPIDYKSDSDYRRINLKRKIDNILAIKNNKSQQVTPGSNTKEKPKCLFRLLELDKSLGKDEDGMEEDSDSSSDEDHEMSFEERKEISSSKKFKQSGSCHGLNYIEPNVIICQNSARMSQVCPNPLTDRGTGSGETSNTFSQKQQTNTEIVVEEGFGTTLPNTVVCNTSDEKVLCTVAESQIHQIPKSESTRSDCMFQDLTFQTIDYSMDTLHKVNQIQTDIKNTEVTMDCDIIKDITNNHTLKQEFCSNSRETPPNLDQQSSMESKTNTKFCSTNEIYGSLNKDVIKQRLQFDNIEDPQMCTQERILTKTSSTGDSSFRLSHEFFEKESVLRNAQSINSCNKCGQAKRLLGKNVENHFSNEQMLREEFMSPVIQREPMTLKNWSLSSSYVNQENNDNVRVNCKQLKTPGVVNSSKHLETHQISRAFPDKIDVNKIELQVQAQHNIFTGDDDCESEGSNLVIDEDHDSIKELNEPNEETYFVLKNIDGSIDKRCSISDLRCYNMRRPKSTHVLPNENMVHAQVIPQNEGVDKSNRSNLKIDLNDSIFLNSPARNVISSCNNDERFYPQENRTFIPRTMYIQNKVNPKESLVNGQCFSSQNADDSIMIQGNVSNCPPVKPIENQSGVPQNERLLSQVKSQNVQIHRAEQSASNSFNSIQDSLHSPRKSPALLSEGFNNLKIYQNGELDSYYCSGRNDLSLTNSNTTELNELNQPSVSPNATFQGSNNHIQQCERPNLLVSNYHNSSVEYNTHEEHVVVYIQPNHADYLNSSKIQQFSHNQGPTEVNEEMMQKVNISNTSYSTLDPLCLVANSKDHTREIGIDFEYFGVCEEVEVTSATEIGQNELCRSNETEDPDVSIAAEHSVTDSSVPLQALGFLYSPKNKTNIPVCIDEFNDRCSVNSLELQQVSTDCSYPDDLAFDKERFELHVKTVQVDYNLCSSQCEFKEFYMSQEVPQAIPVPYPLENRADKSPVRCVCEQCSDNHNILLNNYNILTNFRNAKVKPFNVCSNETQTYDKVQTSETDCNLPLKKRKTLTSSNNSEETTLTSYPNTPMISIAQLELTSDKPQNQTIVSKTQSKLKSPSSCSVVPQSPINYAQYTSPQQLQDEEPLCTRRRSTRRRKSTR